MVYLSFLILLIARSLVDDITYHKIDSQLFVWAKVSKRKIGRRLDPKRAHRSIRREGLGPTPSNLRKVQIKGPSQGRGKSWEIKQKTGVIRPCIRQCMAKGTVRPVHGSGRVSLGPKPNSTWLDRIAGFRTRIRPNIWVGSDDSSNRVTSSELSSLGLRLGRNFSHS